MTSFAMSWDPPTPRGHPLPALRHRPHHGGGVGIGYSQHAGQVIVADGTEEMDVRLDRVLTNDPLTGIFRHADAGYEDALQCAKENNVKIPML